MRAAITFEPAEFVSPDGEDLPTGLRARTKFYTVPVNGVKVRVMLTTAAKDEPRGTIILYPGRTEFIEKYLETAEDFIARGFTVLIMDPRGQGLSARLLPDRLRSYVDDFQDYADDLAGVVESFIGMIRLLSFFGMAKNTLPFQRGQAGIPVPFAANKLTSDPERYAHWARYFNTSEALRLGPPTYGWIVQALRAMNFVNKNADKLKVATLIVAAGADPIVEPSSNREFAAAAGADFAVVPGALHELFLERDELRDQFFQKVDSFLEDNAF